MVWRLLEIHGPLDVYHEYGKVSYVTAEVKYINKVPFPYRKDKKLAIRLIFNLIILNKQFTNFP